MKSGHEIMKLIKTFIDMLCAHYFKRNIFSVNYFRQLFFRAFCMESNWKMIEKLN